MLSECQASSSAPGSPSAGGMWPMRDIGPLFTRYKASWTPCRLTSGCKWDRLWRNTVACDTLVPTGRSTDQPSPGAVFCILVTTVGFMPFSWQLGVLGHPLSILRHFPVSSVAHRRKMLSLPLHSRQVSEGRGQELHLYPCPPVLGTTCPGCGSI